MQKSAISKGWISFNKSQTAIEINILPNSKSHHLAYKEYIIIRLCFMKLIKKSTELDNEL